MTNNINKKGKGLLSEITGLAFIFNRKGEIVWSNNERTLKKTQLQKSFKLRFVDKIKMMFLKNFNIYFNEMSQRFNVKLFDKVNQHYLAVTNNSNAIENVISQMDFLINIQEAFYLLNLNIDKFKQINQSKGYQFGNEILEDFKIKLNKFFDLEIIENPYCDQFIVISRDCKKNIEAKLDQLIHKDCLKYKGFIYSVSVGLIDCPLNYKDSEELLLASEKALSIAKRKYFSKKKYCDYYKKTLADHVYSFLSHHRLNPDEFYMCYQPILSTKRKTIGYEALLRWENKKLGLVSPYIFIPIAEELGCIHAITEMVIEKVIDDYNENYELFRSQFITINISVNDLTNPKFLPKLRVIRRENPEVIEKFVFEITESLDFEKLETLNKLIKEIQNLGIRVFIDDFGIGFSSLDRIMNTTIDGIKIDRSFTNNLLAHENHKILLDSLLFMAKNFNIDMIIEGVETKEQYDHLESLSGCFMQGYYFSKPKRISELTGTIAIDTC